MKACEKPEVTLYDIESQTSEVSGGKIEMSVTFGMRVITSTHLKIWQKKSVTKRSLIF